MKKLLVIVAFSLAGCSTILDYIPSRWDVNQAKVITDLQQQSRNFDCKGDQAQQLKTFASTLEWFDIYAKTKPTRDIAKLTTTLDTTVKEYQDRLAKGPVSPMYCSIKTKLINQQVEIISGSVQGRF